MKLLLDTCTFIWMIKKDPMIPPGLRNLICDPQQDVFLSSISVWEALVKIQIGKLRLLTDDPASEIESFREELHIDSLDLDSKSILHLLKLPSLHRDPFDRMLICQATEHGLSIVTPDPKIQAYPVKILWN